MRARFVLRGRVLTPAHVLDEASLLVEAGRIAWVRPGLVHAPGAELLTAPGDTVAPGFLDLQVNGLCGEDAQAGPEAVAAIAVQLPASGVTGFLPTVISRPLDELLSWVTAVAGIGPVAAAPRQAARVLGVHVEGPFLNPEQRGAHDERWLVPPAPALVERLVEAGPRMVTLAPELHGGLEAVRRLHGAGLVVAAGHTGASYAEGRAAVDAGVRFATHLFNAMTPWHHREPGVAGALMDDPRVTLGVIADGVHVHPSLLGLVTRARGGRRIALTTDQTAAAGMPPGRYRLGKGEVLSDGRAVRRPDGTLAGSAATMDQLVRRMAGLAGLRRAVTMASAAPARLLGVDGGRIAEGEAADLVVLDRSLHVRTTLVGGRLAYRRRGG